MKKKRGILLLAAAVIVIGFMFLGGSAAFAVTDPTTGLEYTVADNEATITDYEPNGFVEKLDIPGTLGGATVVSIGDHAFDYSFILTAITLPDSVKTIGEEAFYRCYELTEITIPDDITIIGDGAFNGCSKLAGFAIPDGITSIGDSTFFDCSSLTGIVIPDSVTSIGNNAFNGCRQLTGIEIPDGITIINEGVFASCTSLTDITIPAGVTSIGNGAFSGCTSLAGIAIPDSVTSIGTYAFYGSGLVAIPIAEGVTSICEGTFSYCSNLADITIPDSITSIGLDAFWNCPRLTNVTIPDSVTSIDERAFALCMSLTSVTLPNSITSINPLTFFNCSSLASIIIPNGVTSIGNSAFAYCRNLSNVTISDSVTEIDSFAFIGCVSMENITIPDNVTYIGFRAFSDCQNLKSVKIPKSVTSISNAFDNCSSSLTIYGYAGSYAQAYAGDDNIIFFALATIDPTIASFNKNPVRRADVNTTITWNDASSVADVKKDGVSIGADAYSVTGSALAFNTTNSALTIKKEYLVTQPTGTIVLTVEFDRGTPVTLTIDISDATPANPGSGGGDTPPVVPPIINPIVPGFDKNIATRVDVSTTITWNDASSVVDIKKGGTSIGANSYSINGSALSIKKEYLATQPTGTLVLTVEFDRGTPVTLTIDISDTTPAPVNSASINPASASFDKNTANRADVSTAITWNDASSVTDVKKAGTSIGANAYGISGGTLTIRKDFLATQATGSLALTVEFDRGTPVTLTINISDTTPAPVNSASINPASASFDKNTANRADVSTAITWNDASSVTDVKKAGASIGANAYGISGSTLTIRKDFLATQATGSLALTVEFDRGTPATLTINISDTTQEPSGPPTGGGGGGGGGLPPAAPNPPPAAADKLSPTVSIDRASGTAAASVSGDELNKAFDAAKAGSGGVKTIKIEIPEAAGVNSYVLQLPSSVLASTGADRQIELKSAAAGITLPGNMLQGAGFAAAGNIGISIGKTDVSKLPQTVQDDIGSRPVIELMLTQGNKAVEWNNPDAPVTVAVPYVPTAEELKNPEHIVIWYLDGAGNAVSVPSGRYDAAAGAVVFTTTHFSRYAVVYAAVTFDDLGSAAWAKNQIEVLASKGIMRGASEKEFTPQAKITRADFMYSLIRALGADAEVEMNFDDIDKDAYYYKEIGMAKKLGITSGTGNNRFSPDSVITRQDMMVLTDKALKLIKKLKLQGPASELEKFTDRSLIASYATGSIASIVKEGLIVGSGGGINPLGSTTRAEAAVFLYKIYNKY